MGFPFDTRDSRPESTHPTAMDPLDRLALWLAVVGGAGFAPVAPGTAGSLVGLATFAAVFPWLAAGTPLAAGLVMLGLIGLLFAIGVWASGRAGRLLAQESAEVAGLGASGGIDHDDGRIVIDEFVGQWVALLPLVLLGRLIGDTTSLLLSGVTGFVLFRVFDIAKPGAVGWAERRFAGGLGVMADDLVAGAYAALGLVGLIGSIGLWKWAATATATATA